MGEGQALPEGVSPAPGPRNQAVSLCGCSEGTSRCPPGPSSAVGKVLRNQKWEQLRSALASQSDSSSMPLPVSFSLWRWAGGVGPAWWWALVQGPVLTGASSRWPCRGCRGPGETALTRFFSLTLVTAAFLSFLRGRGRLSVEQLGQRLQGRLGTWERSEALLSGRPGPCPLVPLTHPVLHVGQSCLRHRGCERQSQTSVPPAGSGAGGWSPPQTSSGTRGMEIGALSRPGRWVFGREALSASACHSVISGGL